MTTGYKRTEVGVIPSDWKIDELGKVMDVNRGGSPRPIQNYLSQDSSGINWIKIGDVGVNAKYIDNTQGKIIESGAQFSRRVFKGDFLLSNSMSFGRPYISRVEGCIHDGWLVLQNYQRYFELEFLFYLLSSKFVINQYRQKASGSSVLNLNKELVSTIKLLEPSKPEQAAIAIVLSSIDRLIEKMEKLISKKLAVKQGAMQELLTGKRRLPGFGGKWEKRSLEGLVQIVKGEQLNKSELTVNGEFPDWNGGIEPSGYTHKWNRSENTITISEGGNSCGFVNFCRQKFWCGGHCYSLEITDSTIEKMFLFQLLKLKEKSIMNLRIGSGLPNIQKKTLKEFILLMPRDSREQSAIAEVIGDMHAEIEKLEHKRAKYVMLKQGMMQVLLTGRIRLV